MIEYHQMNYTNNVYDFCCGIDNRFESDMGSSTLVLVLKYNKYSPSQYLQSI